MFGMVYDQAGFSCLHKASWQGNFPIVEFLVKTCGANVDITSEVRLRLNDRRAFMFTIQNYFG
jgi:hypothetical protein